jgi:hypothetical protein
VRISLSPTFNPLRSFADLDVHCRYGHGVLRNPDPRFMALQEFCDARPELMSSPIIQMVKKVRSYPQIRVFVGSCLWVLWALDRLMKSLLMC